MLDDTTNRVGTAAVNQQGKNSCPCGISIFVEGGK